MIDHVFLSVSDVARSRVFYAATLASLGWFETGMYSSASGPAGIPNLYGFADASGASIWLRQARASDVGAHVGFVAPGRTAVDASYRSAMAAGAEDNGQPAVREYFTPTYYAANVVDFDGNSLEFVTKV